MLLSVDPASAEPIYLQLVRQVRAAIQGRSLAAGAKLPSHRELALSLLVNHLTVKRAFDELESEGLLTTRRGLGTFVVESLPASLGARTREAISVDLARAATAARSAQLTRRDWDRLSDAAWTEHI